MLAEGSLKISKTEIARVILCAKVNAVIVLNNGINPEIINIHTIKPLDENIILKSVKKTGCIVSAEEHNIFGGLGESVARLLTSKAPYPQEFVGTNDTFGESGTPTELMNKYGLNMDSIYDAVMNVMKRKAK